MSVSVELRFWWDGDESARLLNWITRSGRMLSEAEEQSHRYFITGSDEVGLKLNEDSSIEIKSMIQTFNLNSPSVHADCWVKCEVLAPGRWSGESCEVIKQRRLATFDFHGEPVPAGNTVQTGYQIELSRVQLADSHEVWSTLCIEAFGQSRDLRWTLDHGTAVFGELPNIISPPSVGGYPKWLRNRGYG